MSSGYTFLLQQILSRATGRSDLELPALRPIEGGSINATYRITTKDGGLWFCKINDKGPLPDLFAKEKQGLDLLRQQGIFRIPAVVACDSVGGKQVLVLERIDQGIRNEAFWSLFVEQLARLHRVTADSRDSRSARTESGITGRESGTSARDSMDQLKSLPLKEITGLFGLDHDNYMGSLPQQNTHSPGWTNFFIQRRLQPQIRLAAEKGLLGTSAIRQFERLYQVLPEIFPAEAPSLLHGDLLSAGRRVAGNITRLRQTYNDGPSAKTPVASY